MHVVMIASENGALPGGKVGGIGDVIRDVPQVLARHGHQVTVINPGYQFLSRLPGARLVNTLTVEFAGSLEKVELYEVESNSTPESVRLLLLEHPLFGSGGEHLIYHHDQYEPFATDSRTFALFCHAVCFALVTGAVPKPDVLHLHDWHSAMLLVLRRFNPAFKALQQVRTVFSIHNLSLQGIRPFADNWSSPSAWFPGLKLPRELLVDPRYPDCINLMRAGIRLADRVHVVSPTYAKEVQLPSQPELGIIRGEGLEMDLQEANANKRLFGILNGCEYGSVRIRPVTHKQFLTAATTTLELWADNKFWIKGALFAGLQRLQAWGNRARKPPMVVASVGRLTSQKVKLLMAPLGDGRTALDHLLQQLDHGIMVVLGSGDERYERFLMEAMQRHGNFLFLNGFSEELADVTYRYCDLFLMPSSFEPCGISQMLAMRAGTPCLVHKVGGLADTVEHMVNGFSFHGDDLPQQVVDLLKTFEEVLQIQSSKPAQWQGIRKNASESRFSWDAVIEEYLARLYS
jgi:starch synthase